MEVLLRLEIENRSGTSSTADVAVDLEPSHTVAALTDAVARHLGLQPSSIELIRGSDRRPLERADQIGGLGLLSGESLIVGEPAPGRRPAPLERRRSELDLAVTSGPDVGRQVAVGLWPLSVGRDRSCDLALRDPNVSRVHLELVRRPDGTTTVYPSPEARGPVVVDGEIVDSAAEVGSDHVIRIGATTLGLLAPAEGPSTEDRALGQVPFHRTPYYPAPVERRVFEALGDVPERPEPSRFAYLAALAPLAVGFALAVLYSPRMLVIAVFSPVIAVAGHVEQRRRHEARFGRSEQRFRRRLADRRAEITEALATERGRRFGAAPDLAVLAERARRRTVDLWPRDRRAPDFLVLRLGLGAVEPAVVVDPETRGDEILREEVEAELAALVALADVPITADVTEDNVLGLVGNAADTTELVASLVLQAACLHSPEDLVVTAAVAGGGGIDRWLHWLPHARSASSPLAVDHVARTAASADRLLRELLAVAEERGGPTDRTIDRRWPWLLAVVDRRLDPDPALMARLLDLARPAGLSVLWLTGTHDRVPRQARAVVDCRPLLGARPSRLTNTDPTIADQELEIDRANTAAAEAIARSLAPLRDASSATSSTVLPRIVTLYETFGVEEVTGAWVARQWQVDRPYSLIAPIGLSVGGPLVVDLVGHGPHGLIGGTSGAGKSELVMSIVAGLIAHNPPTRVNFLFVDYKGGASSDPFRAVPHTVGYVTNLDALLARRALTSLRAELDRRMELLRGRAKDLAEMIERHPDEAPPSLVIVVDEFATLVEEVPEFMAGIVDIAQRGRSLGIHLLLATQRPSGAVNDNILANTNLRISLRMLDGSESTSVIGTPEAAAIPTPSKGRAFARIGPGELIAFQSAWSGAPRRPRRGPPPVTVRPLGFDTAGAGPDAVGAPAAAGTQIEALIAAVLDAAAELGLARGRSPWRDELPTDLPLDEVRPVGGNGAEVGRTVTVGLIDDPERQAQYPATIDLEAGGGLVVIGTGGSGKTTLLRTAALSAALDDTEAGGGHLAIFGLDFASRELTALTNLPQCAGVATGDDLEAVTRFVAALDDALQRRRAGLAAATRDGRPLDSLTRVLLLIDDYGNLAQAFEGAGAATNLYGWLETINGIIVDGRQVGIHTVLTASRRTVVKASLLSAISNRIVLRQADSAGYAELGVAAAVAGGAELVPGRGFIDGPKPVQVAVAVGSSGHHPGAADPAAAIRSAASELAGSVDEALRTESLPFEVGPLAATGEPLVVALGLGDMGAGVVRLDLSIDNLTVLGDPRSGRSSALVTIAQQLGDGGVEVWAVGPAGSPLLRSRGLDRATFGRPAEIVALLDDLVEKAVAVAPEVRPLLVVDDFDLVEDPVLDPPMARLCSAGVRVVAATASLRGYSTNQLALEMKKARSILYLRPPGGREVQEVTGCPVRLRPGLPMPPGRGVLVVNRCPVVVQVSRPADPVE